MDQSRRTFLKKTSCMGLGLGCGFPLLSTACNASKQESVRATSSSSQLAMVIDVKKCLGEDVRRSCAEACKLAHNLPEDPNPAREIKWIWTEQFEHVFPEQAHEHVADGLKGKPVLVLCNHCTNPACVKVCPTGATWKRESDGIVAMDMHRCIGCRYCVVACPYGARSFNWGYPRERIKKDKDGKLFTDYPTRTKGVVEKCTFCVERIRLGEKPVPACVEAANKLQEGALAFGNLSDPDSDVSRLLRDNHTVCRSIGLGTGPNVYYIV